MASAKEIQEIRNETGLGVMDIKNAMEGAGDDKAKALEILKQRAGEKMEKRAGRATGQGKIGAYIHGDGKSAVMLEVNCETDFVAKNDDFNDFVKDVMFQIIAMKPLNVEELLEQEFVKDGSNKVSDLLKALIAKTGENIVVNRFVVYTIGEDAISC